MVHFLQDILKKASQRRLRRRIPADLPSGPGGRSPPLRRRCHRISWAEISMRWAGNARPLALPLGELARRKP